MSKKTLKIGLIAIAVLAAAPLFAAGNGCRNCVAAIAPARYLGAFPTDDTPLKFTGANVTNDYFILDVTETISLSVSAHAADIPGFRGELYTDTGSVCVPGAPACASVSPFNAPPIADDPNTDGNGRWVFETQLVPGRYVLRIHSSAVGGSAGSYFGNFRVRQ